MKGILGYYFLLVQHFIEVYIEGYEQAKNREKYEDCGLFQGWTQHLLDRQAVQAFMASRQGHNIKGR